MIYCVLYLWYDSGFVQPERFVRAKDDDDFFIQCPCQGMEERIVMNLETGNMLVNPKTDWQRKSIPAWMLDPLLRAAKVAELEKEI